MNSGSIAASAADSMAVWLGATGLLGSSEYNPAWSVRSDGWENDLTGLGTLYDKTTFTQYRASYDLSDSTLEFLYSGDDLAARLIDTVPEEKMRKGYRVCLADSDSKIDKDLEASVHEALADLDANSKFVEADKWGRLWGGAAIIIGADDRRPAGMPLIPERAERIDFLEVTDRRYLQPATYYTNGPKTGRPETYMVANSTSLPRNVYTIHESRLILFGGASTTTQERLRRNSWDHSYLQRAYDIMQKFANGFSAVGVLLTDGPQGVYSIKNLANMIGGSGRAVFEERMQLIERCRSVLRAIVVDADGEKFERAGFSFSGIPDVLDRLMLRLAAAFRMPVTILMGQSPAGMNATGESDFRWFYDRIETEQTNELAPQLRRLVKILLATRQGPSRGKVPDKVAIEFEKLWSLGPKEEAERQKIVADTDAVYLDRGVVMPEEVALSRFGERGWQDGYSAVDRELRETALENEKKALSEGQEDTPRNPDLLTPTAKETVITVNQALAAEGLPPDPDPEIGNMKVAEYRALQEAKAAKLGEHQAAEETGEPTDAEIKAKQAEAAANAPPAPGQPPKGPNAQPGTTPQDDRKQAKAPPPK
jgi:phage-related protein (TIGR01555 family)